MKKIFIAIIATAVLSLLACTAFASVDSTQTVLNNTAQATQTVLPAQDTSGDVQTIAGNILDLLSALGYSVGGWRTFILLGIGFIWRLVELKFKNEKHANELDNIVEAIPKSVHTSAPIGKIQEMINRLRGIKPQKS